MTRKALIAHRKIPNVDKKEKKKIVKILNRLSFDGRSTLEVKRVFDFILFLSFFLSKNFVSIPIFEFILFDTEVIVIFILLRQMMKFFFFWWIVGVGMDLTI